MKRIIAIVVLLLIAGALYNFAKNRTSEINTSAVLYKNTEYGFQISLPESWRGYFVIIDKWSDNSLNPTENGPLISIRHPQWTAPNPRQDIPIMVFTLTQWNDMQADKFHIGAAPINPTELYRNAQHVFALPARYNFAFQTGIEEIEQILQSNFPKLRL